MLPKWGVSAQIWYFETNIYEQEEDFRTNFFSDSPIFGSAISLLPPSFQFAKVCISVTCFCWKVCTTIQELAWHVRVHNMRTFKTPKAGAAGTPGASSQESGLTEDPLETALLEIVGDNLKCGVCERRFHTEQELLMHMASNAEAHECPECGRRMENAFYLRVHRLIHKQPHR